MSLRTRTIPGLCGACFATLLSAAGAAPAPWIQAEPFGATDPGFSALDFLSLRSDAPRSGSSPASTWGAYCAEAPGDSAAPGIDAVARAACAEKAVPRIWNVTLDLGFYPLERPSGAIRPFERFDGTWRSERVDPELGAQWARLPPVAAVNLRYPITAHSIVAFRMGLHRDLSAWNKDASGSNVPLSDREVDLNEPSLGYFHAEDEHYAFTVGRFPVHWSPSPEYGLALSRSVPYHNGAEFALKMAHVRYRFLASSLNPWLEGTPAGDSANADYPPGSEEYRQRHYPNDNGASLFHNRIYDARVKTLFAHRLEGELGPLSMGATETSIIGGKPPDLRDAGPFVVFHNDFKEGYANGAIGLDGKLRLPWGVALLAEYYIDDVNYSETEGAGNTANLQGWMAGIRQGFSAGGWLVGQSLHAIRTDPYLYSYLQPLNSASSRIILASNNQRHGESVYVDKYVIDYPIGYFRGGDALDFWYRMDAWKGDRFRAGFAAGLLAKGEVNLYTPYENYYSAPQTSPSGVAERELRLGLDAERRLRRGLSVHAGIDWQRFWSEGHVRGKGRIGAQAMCGAAWALPN
jgi:hypothetical protein